MQRIISASISVEQMKVAIFLLRCVFYLSLVILFYSFWIRITKTITNQQKKSIQAGCMQYKDLLLRSHLFQSNEIRSTEKREINYWRCDV